MSDIKVKRKQLAALELLLTMTLSMVRLETPADRASYRKSNEHMRANRVITERCKELGIPPETAEDEVRRLVCRLMGMPNLLIPNRSISVGMDNDLWHSVQNSN